MPDNPATVALEEFRERYECVFDAHGRPDLLAAVKAVRDVPLLLKALEAALKHHQPVQVHGTAEDSKGNVTCGHGPDYDGDAHYEGDDGLWYCESLPGPVACSGCPGSPDGEYADWPCDEYKAILAALTGKEAPDDRVR
jgi:hypothetical protein